MEGGEEKSGGACKEGGLGENTKAGGEGDDKI